MIKSKFTFHAVVFQPSTNALPLNFKKRQAPPLIYLQNRAMLFHQVT